MIPGDFDARMLRARTHRPWPMPERPWVMTQTWHGLLFAHWPVETRDLRALVPAALELDVFEGQAWIGVVPFRMTNVAPRGAPALPRLSAFPELNVRTYVRVGGRPGVWFFSLDAANRVAVLVARELFHLPYCDAAMQVAGDAGGWIAYRSRRTGRGPMPAELRARYRPVGPAVTPEPGTLEHFL